MPLKSSVAVTDGRAQFGPPRHETGLRYLACLVALVLGGSGPRVAAQAPLQVRDTFQAPRFKAVAFDYFVLFNPDSIVPEVERVFPGRGRELTSLWRTRQFEYSWLRSITDRYADFFAITRDALLYAANALHLPLSPDDERRLLDAYLHLTPWPDTGDALRRLKASGVRAITIANFSPAMLQANAEHAGLLGLFDALVSTDANHTYKPDPRAYRLGMDRLHLAKDDILFAAFGGWDAAGAKSFGYPTYWVNRFEQPAEELNIRADQTSANLAGLLDFVVGDAARPAIPVAVFAPADVEAWLVERALPTSLVTISSHRRRTRRTP